MGKVNDEDEWSNFNQKHEHTTDPLRIVMLSHRNDVKEGDESGKRHFDYQKVWRKKKHKDKGGAKGQKSEVTVP